MSTPEQTPGVGHNSAESVAGDELRQFLERYERLEEEKAAISGDMREIMAEAKARGFDTKAIRRLLALRKKDHAKRQEELAILELYATAIGMTDVFL